ncbi:MAG: hypothetical protein G01um101466_507 [Parcubacteria group bacterium Gr01-1014_66]|nr:MAG: hypothetical protein G01um101466_507 [Parcubacteria group bacterium Gr01-1014_66]
MFLARVHAFHDGPQLRIMSSRSFHLWSMLLILCGIGVYLSALFLSLHIQFTFQKKENTRIQISEENEALELAIQQKMYAVGSSHEKELARMIPIGEVKYLVPHNLVRSVQNPHNP